MAQNLRIKPAMYNARNRVSIVSTSKEHSVRKSTFTHDVLVNWYLAILQAKCTHSIIYMSLPRRLALKNLEQINTNNDSILPKYAPKFRCLLAKLLSVGGLTWRTKILKNSSQLSVVHHIS